MALRQRPRDFKGDARIICRGADRHADGHAQAVHLARRQWRLLVIFKRTASGALDYNDFDTPGPHIAHVSFSILAFRQKLHS
jgi:hypothetical protein